MLHEQGTVTALAFNDPKRLSEVLAEQGAAGAAPAGDGFVSWDSEE